MKILFQHDHPLPVLKYGGTERIIYWLMKGLVQAGHEVFLLGHADSKVEGIGVKLIRQNGADINRQLPPGIDLAHFFTTPSSELDVPYLVTIEGNGSVGEIFHRNTVFVSRKHASLHASDQFVYNCLDFDEYPLHREPVYRFKNFLFLAKASWKVKNLKDCVEAVTASQNKELHIAGGRAFTFSSRIHSYGMVAQDEKAHLFKKCDVLLWPVRWHEPFGIAVIEAFSQGMPVFSSSYGSLPELVSEGMGVVCQDRAQFLELVAREDFQFDPEFIRNQAIERFSLKNMVNEYIEKYKKIIDGQFLNESCPRTISELSPETLLNF